MTTNDAVDVQRLACVLTDAERKAKSDELVQAELQESRQKAEKKAEMSARNAALKETRCRIDQLAKELDEGAEMREVPVRADYDYDAKRVSYVRTDTDEVIDSREMDQFDLQERLPGHEQDVLPPPKRQRKKKHGELTDVPSDGPDAA